MRDTGVEGDGRDGREKAEEPEAEEAFLSCRKFETAIPGSDVALSECKMEVEWRSPAA